MHSLKTIEGKVRAILEKDEEARNDDMTLYLAVCNACLKGTGGNALCRGHDTVPTYGLAEL